MFCPKFHWRRCLIVCERSPLLRKVCIVFVVSASCDKAVLTTSEPAEAVIQAQMQKVSVVMAQSLLSRVGSDSAIKPPGSNCYRLIVSR